MTGWGDARWYVIECYPGKDFEVCRRLAHTGYELWRPMKKVSTTCREGAARTRRCRSVPRFGRYVFLHEELIPSRRFAISTENGVRGFLKRAGSDDPAIVPDEWMDFLRYGKAIVDRRGHAFVVGMRVRINAGPLHEREGLVKTIDENGVVTIGLESFGRLIIESGYLDPLV